MCVVSVSVVLISAPKVEVEREGKENRDGQKPGKRPDIYEEQIAGPEAERQDQHSDRGRNYDWDQRGIRPIVTRFYSGCDGDGKEHKMSTQDDIKRLAIVPFMASAQEAT